MKPTPSACDARSQGGLLNIHENTGQRAFEAANLLDGFRHRIHRGGQATRVLDRNGQILFDEADDGQGGRPEVMRGDLRRLLLNALPEGAIRWGCKLTGVAPLRDGRHALRFADGSEEIAALLVGADGAWSKVRPLLSDAAPAYTGLSFVETTLQDADARHPASAEAVGRGSLFAVAPGRGLFAHREPGGMLHAYTALERPAAWFDAIDFRDPGAARVRIAAEFDGWAPALTALITEGETAPILRPIHALPSHHGWDRVPGVTLLGDAAHLAPPAGEGANLAMLDGAELAHAIVASPGDTETALSSYEAALFPRGTAAAADAHATLEICFGPRAPFSLVDFFSGGGERRRPAEDV